VNVVVKFVLVAILEKFGGRFVCAPRSVNCPKRTGPGGKDGPVPATAVTTLAHERRLPGMM
jgi:hypothetical protein